MTGIRSAPADQLAVDVVVNSHNYARYVTQAVDSALAQDHPGVRVVVVDDGSSDGSLELLEAYAGRIELVAKENGGQPSAVNAGFERCRGQVVIFLDADDLLRPGTAGWAAASLAAHPEAVRVQWRMELIDAAGRSLGGTRPSVERPIPRGDLRRAELCFPFDQAWGAMSSNAFRVEALAEIMPMPEAEYGRWGADWYLVHLSALLGEVESLDEVGGSYRVHGANAFEPAAPVLDLQRIRNEVGYQQITTAELGRLADKLSLNRPRRILSLSNVAVRLISLRLDPDRHPVSGDHRLGLLRDGLLAAGRRFDSSPVMRLALVGWLAAIAVMPRPVAARLAALLVFPELRPRASRLLARLHRAPATLTGSPPS